LSKNDQKWANILKTFQFWEKAKLLKNTLISPKRQSDSKKKVLENKVDRFFYIVEELKFSYNY
jgi:hypothetical protein